MNRAKAKRVIRISGAGVWPWAACNDGSAVDRSAPPEPDALAGD